MNIEPDSIILPRLYPWLEKSKLRMMTFMVLSIIGLFTLGYVWLTRFYSPFVTVNIILGAILVILFFIYFRKVLGAPIESSKDSAMDFCPECGSLQIGSRYCPDCGRKNY